METIKTVGYPEIAHSSIQLNTIILRINGAIVGYDENGKIKVLCYNNDNEPYYVVIRKSF